MTQDEMIIGQRPYRYTVQEKAFFRDIGKGHTIVGDRMKDHGRLMQFVEYSKPYKDENGERVVDLFAVQVGENRQARKLRLEMEME
jgi:hypothetical protein